MSRKGFREKWPLRLKFLSVVVPVIFTALLFPLVGCAGGDPSWTSTSPTINPVNDNSYMTSVVDPSSSEVDGSAALNSREESDKSDVPASQDKDATVMPVAGDADAFNVWISENRARLLSAGFVEAAVGAEPNQITLLWTGSSPVQDEVRKEAARRSVEISFNAVRFTDSELKEGTAQIWAARDSFSAAGFQVDLVQGADLEHDGLRVVGRFIDGNVTKARIGQVEEIARAVTRVAIEVQGDSDVRPA